MGVACLFLAAKIEEDCRRIRDVINVFHHLRQRRLARCVLLGREPLQLVHAIVVVVLQVGVWCNVLGTAHVCLSCRSH